MDMLPIVLVCFCRAMVHLKPTEMICFWARDYILRKYFLFLKRNHSIWGHSKFVANGNQVPLQIELGVGDIVGTGNWLKGLFPFILQ